MDKLTSLRRKHPLFSYESFTYKQDNNSLVISFLFRISPSIEFNPKITIKNIDTSVFASQGKAVIDNFIFNLGLIEMISYWKTTCSPIIEIKTGSLNKTQIGWWKNLLIKGLGDFFYKNNINFKEEGFVNLESIGKNIYLKDEIIHKNRYLILNGGGRDSVVSVELLKSLEKEVTLFMLNPTEASISVAKDSAIVNQIIVNREIDKKLLELNETGYLNGHTPFSAYLAFLSSLCGLIFDYKFVIPSNERSSNEENVEFLGEKINHQYSKSFEFEKSFREYLKENLSENIEYLSLLRPLYEMQISKLFATHKKYFKDFKSCNNGQKNNIWCRKCPKCLSIYTSLYPFLNTNDLTDIFGEDLYAKKELLDLLLHITGEKRPKPFECVGTYKEILLGLNLSAKKLEVENRTLPFLLKYAKDNIIDKNAMQPEILTAWDKNNFLSDKIAETLKTQSQK